MRSAMDLEHSFGPAYARGRLLKGTAAMRGDRRGRGRVGRDGGWRADAGDSVAGLLPAEGRRAAALWRAEGGGSRGAWRTTAERMAWLNREAAEFALYELDERSEELTPVDFRDTGNLDCKLVHAFSAEAALQRCRAGIDRIRACCRRTRAMGSSCGPAARGRWVCICMGWNLRGCGWALRREALRVAKR